jgi:serralysin
VLTEKARDTNGNGMIDLTTTYTHNDRGQLISEVTVDSADAVTSRGEWIYNATGYRISKSGDNDGDGPNPAVVEFSEYDANGNQTLLLGGSIIQTYDDRGNIATSRRVGSDSIETYTYDANGNNTLVVESSGGSATYETVRVYDDNDNRISVYYSDLISTPVRTTGYINTYDAIGNLTREESDSNGDGVPNSLDTTYTYDDMGNQTSENYYSNGIVVEIYTSTFDANGNETTQTNDYDADGVSEETYTYTFDANGNRTKKTYERYDDGVFNRRTIETFANGKPTGFIRDMDGDGISEYISTRTYDVNGKLSQSSIDSDGDGSPERSSTLTYDANGYLVQVQSTDGNGIVLTTTTQKFGDVDGLWTLSQASNRLGL